MMLIDREKLMQAKETLADRNAELMAEALGLNYDEKKMRACCCFHAENTPSLIYNPKNYTFHCFGCQKTVDLIDVLMLGGMTYLEAAAKLFDLADMKYSFGEMKVKTKHQYRYPKEVVCSSREAAEKYLARRKISPKTMDHADVREDAQGNVVFNFYDTNDVLTMVKYRPSHKTRKGEHKTWCQKDADTANLLFNMNRVNVSCPLLVTEGEIDCLSAIEAGYPNAVSVPLGAGNTQWIEENWDWLEQFPEIILCTDNDECGVKLQKEAVFRLGSWRTKVVDIPHTAVTAKGETVPVKDLNEILFYLGKQAVLDLILNAKDSPVDSVCDFSDIHNVDLDELDGITTGIHPLDKSLMKLFYGTFNIVTGVNGSGKSSFLSQLVCQSLEQNKNVFLYSGELPNFQMKNWINFVLSGQRHVKQYQFCDSKYYKVQPEAQKKINEFYRGRLFIYKDGHPHTVTALLKSMEDTARKYGAKLLIIDNLTAVNLECSDNAKYEKQAMFVNDLIDFAKKFNVCVVLVVHPHKLETMRRMTKMDIQGMSAIIDLAHRILSLYRVTEADKRGKPKKNGKGWFVKPIRFDVLCDILKDRMMGFEGQSAGLYYDRPSRRFFTNEADLDFSYAWDKAPPQGALPFPPPQLARNDETEVFGDE